MNTIALLCVVLASPAAPPRLQCPTPVVAKGDVKGGPLLVHVFELRNTTAAGILTITDLEAGCGCLRRHLSASVLQPGETTKLTIEVNTLTQPDGPNRWGILVRHRWDQPGVPTETDELPLRIEAKVVREISLTPPQLALSATGQVVRTLTLTDRRAKPLTLTRSDSSSPHLKAEISPRLESESRITLTLAADAPPGTRDETVVLYSDDPEYPEFRVPVRVEKRAAGMVSAVPEEVSLRFTPGGETTASMLVQLRGSGNDVAIAKVESDHPAVAAKWSTSRGPVATIRVTAQAPKGAGKADLRVHLAEPAGQLLILPVTWTSQP